MCFASDTGGDCTLVLPFRELASAELTDAALAAGADAAGLDNTVYLTTRGKTSFMLGGLQDPAALVDIIREGLTSRPVTLLRPGQADPSAPSTPTRSGSGGAPSGPPAARSAIPLYKRFGTQSGTAATAVKTGGEAPINAVKEHLWKVHFSEYAPSLRPPWPPARGGLLLVGGHRLLCLHIIWMGCIDSPPPA